MSFSSLILQQVLFHHLVDEYFAKGIISQQNLHTMGHQRKFQLNSIQAKLHSFTTLTEAETVLIISQYFIDKTLDTPFQTIDQLENFIKTLTLKLPKSFEPLMDAIRRKFLLYNIECFNHPYINSNDLIRLKNNIDSLSKMIHHCLIESDLAKIKKCNEIWTRENSTGETIKLNTSLRDFGDRWFPFIGIKYDKKHGSKQENERYYMNQVEKHIYAMKALCIKLQSYLPRLNPNHVRELQQEHRLLLKSKVYRAIKFGLDQSNRAILQQAIHALPSQHKLSAEFDPRSMMVIVPTIGDIILSSYDPLREEILMECISMALVQYGTISEAEGEYLNCRLSLDLENMKASFKYQPFEIEFEFHGKLGEPHDYTFKLVLNDYYE